MAIDAKSVFISLLNAIQAGKIYAEGHPKYQEFIDLLYERLSVFLDQKREIVLGIVEDELAWENEIFFDLSRRLTSLIAFLKECEINRISFRAGLQAEELARFIVFLTRPGKKKVMGELEGQEPEGMPHISVGKLRSRIQAGGPTRQAEERRTRYAGSVEFASRSLTAVLNKEEIDWLDFRFNLLNVMEVFMGRHQELLNLVSVKDKDVMTFIHLLHVSVLAMFFASKLGLSKDEALDVAIAALFHDIGKLHISSKVLKKHGTLADEEFIHMKEHPVFGSMILQEYQSVLGILPAVVAFEHHLRYDMKGYPKVAYPHPPHMASLIVSQCDVYDALAQKRSYKADYPPDKIYGVMSLEKGKTFDPALLDRFFQALGVWPVGSIVRLTDGRAAVVREVNEQDIFRPRVEIIFPEETKEIVDLLNTKGKVQILEALNPQGNGRDFLRHIHSGESSA